MPTFIIMVTTTRLLPDGAVVAKAKKSSKNPHLLAQIFGWYGAAAIIIGFLLISFEIIKPNTVGYQLLNLSGALGLMILGIDRHVRQSVVVNIFWITIASLALVRLIFN